MASAAAAAPSEWPMIPTTGPPSRAAARATALIARTKSARSQTFPDERACAGASKAITENPAASSGATKRPSRAA
jgi:hypothetical protein